MGVICVQSGRSIQFLLQTLDAEQINLIQLVRVCLAGDRELFDFLANLLQVLI